MANAAAVASDGAILIGHQCRMLLAAVGQLEHQRKYRLPTCLFGSDFVGTGG
jgi:hypothetical protein